MSISTIHLMHDDYQNLTQFMFALEEAIIKEGSSEYLLIIFGKTDPLINPIFYQNGYATMVRLADIAKHLRVKLDIQIDTKMPYTVHNKQLRDIFHLYPVGIHYHVTNNDMDGEIKLIAIEEAIRKLESWDGKNPMKTKIILNIDKNIHPDRELLINNILKKTYISISK